MRLSAASGVAGSVSTTATVGPARTKRVLVDVSRHSRWTGCAPRRLGAAQDAQGVGSNGQLGDVDHRSEDKDRHLDRAPSTSEPVVRMTSVARVTPGSLRVLLSQNESESLEFKRSVPPPAKLARVLAAFANGNGDVLLFGVDETSSNRAAGVDEARARRTIERAAEMLEPRPHLQVSSAVVDDRTLVAVEVSVEDRITMAPWGSFCPLR